MIVRVIMLTITIFGLTYLMLKTNYYISTFSLGIVIGLQVVFLIQYAERTNLAYT